MQETYLNIYSEWEPSLEFNLDNIAQNCLMLELSFIPYQLYHTDLFIATNDVGHIKEVSFSTICFCNGSPNMTSIVQASVLNYSGENK